ncbi:MAG TPA: hypothetical protein VID94_06275 [Acidimicrobiales bacterium]
MRLTDLLGAEVVEPDGRAIGVVHDVVLVQDGAVMENWGAGLRLHWLLVGSSARWARLGLDRRSVHGPAPVKWLTRRASPPRRIPWAAVDGVADGRITVRAGSAEPIDAD